MCCIYPDELRNVYDKLYKASLKYILIAELYNPTPVEISYRETGKLFKRDFAGEMIDMYRDLVLIDYGFGYRRDNVAPIGDINWFLLQKR